MSPVRSTLIGSTRWSPPAATDGEIDACVADYHDRAAERSTPRSADILSAIPPDRRLLVTNHDALAYFADRYDFEIVGTVIPSSSTLGEIERRPSSPNSPT